MTIIIQGHLNTKSKIHVNSLNKVPNMCFQFKITNLPQMSHLVYYTPCYFTLINEVGF